MSHNPVSRLIRTSGFALLASLSIGLAGCQVQPLYSSSGTSFSSVEAGTTSAELASIDVEKAEDRVELETRNALIFSLTGGDAPLDRRYTLQYRVQTTIANVGFDPNLSRQTAEQVTAYASFRLYDVTTGERLFQGKSTALASYDRSNQRFANVRARRDAENRAAKEIADDIRIKLATYFAGRG
ncbi:LPS assembly lipoprotein LptE [Coralliovum pocilloporae]|uniref:LPS assembly lipoprotein LptE n=1 Tax=Coralliovum pocilloporae TaxID=3066369 RepID=UPI003306FD39